MLLCEDCDKLIETKPHLYSTERLLETKANHEAIHARASLRADAGIALQLFDHMQVVDEIRLFIVDSQGTITEDLTASNLHSSAVPTAPQQSTIGDDQVACAYIAYLMRRYNEFASKEKSASFKFNHKAISQNLETRYKAHWKQIPRVRFPLVCRYLKHRVDCTGIGRGNSRKGLSSYRGYGEFLLKAPDR
jgi:hypothetical protein